MIYKQTGNLRAVQILLGHTKIESTVRYLGVDVEDARGADGDRKPAQPDGTYVEAAQSTSRPA